MASDGATTSANLSPHNADTVLQWRNEDDGDNPFNWPVRAKWTVTLTACYVTFIIGLNAAVITSAPRAINARFGISDAHFPNSFWPVTSWAVGAALTPMVILPILEDYGMRVGYLATYALFVIFVIPQAVAPNFGTLIVCRFFAGCCGGVLQDVMDGIIADIWSTAAERSLPVTCYVFSLLAGVSFGPVMGGAITSGSLYWRWMFYIQLMIYGASAPAIFLLFRETRGPVILSKRARKTAHQLPEKVSTSSSTSPRHTPAPATAAASLKAFIYGNIIRPFRLLFTEPVVLVFTLLSALSYGIVFISTQSVTQVYATNYGWHDYQAGLVQASLVVGEVVGFVACLVQNKIFSRAAAAAAAHHDHDHDSSPTNTSNNTTHNHLPEVRLYLSIPASILGLAGGLFCYGWTTNYPPSSAPPWILPTLGLALIGFGTMAVMQAIMMYITDAYAKYAGSASAAVCFGENVFAAFLPLAAAAMYTRLGFAWASSLLGFVALALSLAPVVLVLKGESIRRRSPFMSEAVY